MSRVRLAFLYTYRSCTKAQEKLLLLFSHKAPLNTEVRGESDPGRSASSSPPVDPSSISYSFLLVVFMQRRPRYIAFKLRRDIKSRSFLQTNTTTLKLAFCNLYHI